MRRFITLLLCSAILCLGSVNAQQIKGDFNSVWVKDTKGNGALPGMYLRPGTQPVGWEASNVHQKVLLSVEQVLVTPDANRTGGDGFSVKMENQEVGAVGITSGAPAYITLGTPWVFAIMSLPDCDGGTLGGVEYTQRPDSLVGYYRRIVGENGAEDALLLAYLWKGTSVSTVRTNSSGGLASEETKEVQDQDLCILGKRVPDSGDAVLIGKAEYNISTTLNEWTRISIPVEYKTDDTPEKMNIVISSANYWVRSDIKSGNFLWADDVELICNAELKKLTVGGVEVDGFNPKVYEYQLPASMLSEEILAEGYGASSSVDIQKNGNVVKIQVTDNTAKGEKAYTYTLTFAGEKTVINIPDLPVACVYGQEVDYVITSNNPGTIRVESSDPSMLKIEDGKLKFLKAGIVAITISQEASETYTAFQKEVLVEIARAPLTVKLMDATSKLARSAVYTFEYEGLTPEDKELVAETPSNVFSKVPEASGYNGSSKVSSGTAMGTYPIKWTKTPEADNYEITTDATEKTLTIGKGLATVSYTLTRLEGLANPGLSHQEISFTNVLSTDRTYNSTTKTYYLKSDVIKEGAASAAFEGTVPDADSPAGKYPVKITSTLTSDKYDFEIAGDNYLLIQTSPTIEIVNFPEHVYYGDTIEVEIATSNDVDPSFLYYARKPDGLSTYNVTFITGTNKMVATAAGPAKIELYVKASGHYLQVSTFKEFDVEKRPLTISAGSYIRDWGEENPEFILDYEGFVFSDDTSAVKLKPTATTLANEASLPGAYIVTLEGGEAANYGITSVNGKLTVMGTPTVDLINFPDDIVYGDEFGLELMLVDATNIDVYQVNEVDGAVNASFSADGKLSATGAGAAQIELIVNPREYYYGTSVVKDFVINKAPLTVTAEDAVRYVGAPNPELELIYDGFKFDEDENTSGVFITAPSATTDADETSSSGIYVITVLPGESKNYAITPVDGKLEIKMGTGIDTPGMTNIIVEAGIGSIIIKGNETRETLSVYDTIGTMVATGNKVETILEGLQSNCLYLVKVGPKVLRILVK